MTSGSTSRRPLRVLHVVGGMNRGGVETWLMHVLRNNPDPAIRHDFLVHTRDECIFDAELRERGSRIFPCPRVDSPVEYARDLRRILREEGPFDVVHSHVHYFSGLVLAVARQAGIRVRVAHSHLDTTPELKEAGAGRTLYIRAMQWLIARFATHRLSASRMAAASLFEEPVSGRALDFEFLPCGVDFSPFRTPTAREAVRRELGIPADALVVAHVGRFAAQKNHLFFVRIADALARQESRVHFLLVGGGELRPSIEDEVARLGLAERFTFAGVRPDVPRVLIGAADAFLFPSLFEGLGLVVLEAQAAGLPCIIADTVPTEADVVPEIVSRLSLQAEPSRWAEAVHLVLGRPAPVSRAEALSRLEGSVFSIDRAAATLCRFYREAVLSS